MYEQGSKEGPVQPQLPGSGVPWSSIKDTFPDLPSHITTQMTSLEKPMQQKRGKIIAKRRKMNKYKKIQRGKGILNKYEKIPCRHQRQWWFID